MLCLTIYTHLHFTLLHFTLLHSYTLHFTLLHSYTLTLYTLHFMTLYDASSEMCFNTYFSHWRLRYAGVLICSSLSILELSVYHVRADFAMTTAWILAKYLQGDVADIGATWYFAWILWGSCMIARNTPETWESVKKIESIEIIRPARHFSQSMFFRSILLHSPDLVFCSCRLLSDWYGERGMENEVWRTRGNKGQGKSFSLVRSVQT